MTDKLQIRPEDFRKAWPNALAVALREGTAILEKIEEINVGQAQHQDRLELLGQKMPVAIRATEEMLGEAGAAAAGVLRDAAELAVSRINDAGGKVQADLEVAMTGLQGEIRRLAVLQQQLNASAGQLMAACDKDRDQLNQLRADIAKERQALARESAKPGFFGRIFGG